MQKLAAVALVSVALAGCGSDSDQPAATSSSSTANPMATTAIDAAALAATKQAVTKDAPALTALSGRFGNHGVVAKDAFGPAATGSQISGATFGSFLAFTSTPNLHPLMVGSPAQSGGGYMYIGREYDADNLVLQLSSPDAPSGAVRQASNPVAHLVSGFFAGVTPSGGITVGAQAALSAAPETAAQARTWHLPRDASGFSHVVLDSASPPPVVTPHQAMPVPADAINLVHTWTTIDWKSAVMLYLQDMQGAVNLCTYVVTPDIPARSTCDVWYQYPSQWVFIGHVVVELTPDFKGYYGWVADGLTTQRKSVEGEVSIKGASGTDIPGKVVNGLLKLRQP